ncbi:hypothetical protein EMIHUDRAFT_235597 [Emiliania huxleyi CCMP1516]|uniref:Heme-binding protein n=2 Tax=Emiliania huxleyi TaxID=2903 RepID=A0A0D3JVQ5_EMIH1|nr:hypothetical protein EMIHUDRAFT_235597 [Emiliania huxleyi CCMP1516]EOD27590.1 hypothetical protein EMIHUDRAFT_235597 [Emiliania huxleyi CCMP1516]|eukprot:XP_005780019.1 hypothetical protein EMIHUDRAFT_235597 [Emiliania huxleyi CCMP1516]
MLALVLTCPGLRAGVPVASAEATARAAWLAKNPSPWEARVTPQAAQAASPSVFHATQAPGNPWLAPGRPMLTLEAADEMSSVALREATACGFNPISVCVLDAGGRVLVLKTMPASSGLTADFAHAKASMPMGPDRGSDGGIALGPRCRSSSPWAPPALAPFPGGVLCRDAAGVLVGAIGVSGAASDEDEHCAITAAQSAGVTKKAPEKRHASAFLRADTVQLAARSKDFTKTILLLSLVLLHGT